MPDLATLGNVASVEILFSAFLPDCRKAWTDEDGATPKISAQRVDAPNAWMDPPIRLLQELYPIDDILAAGLGIGRDRVSFALNEGARTQGYRLIARDPDGAIIHDSEYLVSLSERTYLDEFPGIGKVHPGTGRVSLSIAGADRWEASFPTDLERIWDAYQTKVLPACRKRVEEVSNGRVDAGLQPFFAQLRLDIDASEPDETLPVRHDRVSSLESLHEDLYFAGLDYFQTLGLTSCGKGIDAPGLILPVIRKRSGAPAMRFRLLSEASEGPAIETRGRRFTPSTLENGKAIPSPDVWIDMLDFDSATQSFVPRFVIGKATDASMSLSEHEDRSRFMASYARLLSQGLLEASSKVAGIPGLDFIVGDMVVHAIPPGAAPTQAPLDVRSIDILENARIFRESQDFASARSPKAVWAGRYIRLNCSPLCQAMCRGQNS
jgi:hypothetical protein